MYDYFTILLFYGILDQINAALMRPHTENFGVSIKNVLFELENCTDCITICPIHKCMRQPFLLYTVQSGSIAVEKVE